MMAGAAQKFNAAKEELSTVRQQLRSELAGLRSSWKGSGAAAFAQTREHWREHTQKLNQALGETADAIQKAGTYYSNTDHDSASRLGAISGSDVKLPL